MTFRTSLIQKLIHINENIFFYPKLKAYYKSILKTKNYFILDVGTNKGQSIDFFVNINPNIQIIGFEPNRRLFVYLQNKYKGKKNIEIRNNGVSHKNGTLVFYENVLDETSTFEDLNYNSEYLNKKAKILGVDAKEIISDSYEVNVVSLDTIIDNDSTPSDLIIKIDVEGHEYPCLEGLLNAKSLNKVKYIQIENHNDDMYLNKVSFNNIHELLTSKGFVIDQKIKHGFGDFEEVIFKNN
jgi:FkbM family methyltransferase